MKNPQESQTFSLPVSVVFSAPVWPVRAEQAQRRARRSPSPVTGYRCLSWRLKIPSPQGFAIFLGNRCADTGFVFCVTVSCNKSAGQHTHDDDEDGRFRSARSDPRPRSTVAQSAIDFSLNVICGCCFLNTCQFEALRGALRWKLSSFWEMFP